MQSQFKTVIEKITMQRENFKSDGLVITEKLYNLVIEQDLNKKITFQISNKLTNLNSKMGISLKYWINYKYRVQQ